MTRLLVWMSEHKPWWLIPLLAYVGLVAWLAWDETRTADNPFIYNL